MATTNTERPPSAVAVAVAAWHCGWQIDALPYWLPDFAAALAECQVSALKRMPFCCWRCFLLIDCSVFDCVCASVSGYLWGAYKYVGGGGGEPVSGANTIVLSAAECRKSYLLRIRHVAAGRADPWLWPCRFCWHSQKSETRNKKPLASAKTRFRTLSLFAAPSLQGGKSELAKHPCDDKNPEGNKTI